MVYGILDFKSISSTTRDWALVDIIPQNHHKFGHFPAFLLDLAHNKLCFIPFCVPAIIDNFSPSIFSVHSSFSRRLRLFLMTSFAAAKMFWWIDNFVLAKLHWHLDNLFKIQDILHIRPAPTIDTLVGITYDTQILKRCDQ